MKFNPDFLSGYKTKISTLFLVLALVKGVAQGDKSVSDLFDNYEVILASIGIIYGIFMKLKRRDFNLKNAQNSKDTFQEYITKMQGSFIDYDKGYGNQCVDLAKHYAKNVLGIHLGSFGGSAKTGWNNKDKTFKKDQWRKIKNKLGDIDQVPERGDIIFFEGGNFNPKYGHVAIVTRAQKGSKNIEVLEQNGGSGNGNGKGDNAIRYKSYSYASVVGWYRKV